MEERKKRLLDALKGDDDNSSMEFVVLDETFSDSENTTEENIINETDIKENIKTNIEPQKSLTVEVDVESLSENEDLKTLETNTSEVMTSDMSEKIGNTKVEKSSVEKDNKHREDEQSSMTNKETDSKSAEKTSVEKDKSTKDEKSSISNEESTVVNEVKTPDAKAGHSTVDKEASASKQFDTPDSKGHVKNTLYGTPVINVASPFAKLPSDDKFAKDICDVIYFENLPNSTGKYKKISSLLKRVKSAVDRLQDS